MKKHRTIVYVDGFNFYYGVLKGTAWKWLDFQALFRSPRSQHRKLIGLITPGAPQRKTSWQLRQHSDFVKPIRPWALQASQLPDPIPGTALSKPSTW